MPEPHQRERASELDPQALGLAAAGSAAATLVTSRFGLAGTVLGAALTPVVVVAVKESIRRPTRRLADVGTRAVTRRGETREQTRAGGGAPRTPPRPPRRWPPRWRPPSWHRVLVTATAAFVSVVALFTLPDLILGESVLTNRRTTFFDDSSATAAHRTRAPATRTTSETTTTETTTVTAPVTTAPPASTAP